MGDNNQKLHFASSLDDYAQKEIQRHIQLMSGRMPATFDSYVGKTGTIAMFKPEVQGAYNLPMVQAAIHGDEFTRRPFQKGDKFVLESHDFTNGNMTGLGAGRASSFTRPPNMSSMIAKPVGNVSFTDAIDNTAHETYGRAGGAIHHDGSKTSIVKLHKTNGSSISTGASGDGSVGPHNVQATTDGTQINTPKNHQLQAQNASLTSDGKFTAKSDIKSTSGNISAPAGVMSALAGAFSSFSGGGFGGANGILSGGGSGSAPNIVINANTGVVTAVLYIQTTPIPFVQLPAPAAALNGARAAITDSSTKTFYDPAAGGGSFPVPVICLQSGTDGDGNPIYNWLVG